MNGLRADKREMARRCFNFRPAGAIRIGRPGAVCYRAELVLYPDSFHVKNTLTTTGPGKNPAPIVFDVLHKKDTGTVMTILSPSRGQTHDRQGHGNAGGEVMTRAAGEEI